MSPTSPKPWRRVVGPVWWGWGWGWGAAAGGAGAAVAAATVERRFREFCLWG